MRPSASSDRNRLVSTFGAIPSNRSDSSPKVASSAANSTSTSGVQRSPTRRSAASKPGSRTEPGARPLAALRRIRPGGRRPGECAGAAMPNVGPRRGRPQASDNVLPRGARWRHPEVWLLFDSKSLPTPQGEPMSTTTTTESASNDPTSTNSPSKAQTDSVLDALEHATRAASSVLDSIVGIGRRSRGSGVIVAPNRVLTSAHSRSGPATAPFRRRAPMGRRTTRERRVIVIPALIPSCLLYTSPSPRD